MALLSYIIKLSPIKILMILIKGAEKMKFRSKLIVLLMSVILLTMLSGCVKPPKEPTLKMLNPMRRLI